MKVLILIIVIGIFHLLNIANAAYFDTGMTTFHQGPPYQEEFTARYWGDEFESWRRTSTGYTIVAVEESGWMYYYYALLDSTGEFAKSNNLVGIDPPVGASYNLERSAARQASIELERAAFVSACEQQIQETRQRMSHASSLDLPDVYHVGLLLVRFSDTNYDSSIVNNESINWPDQPFSKVMQTFNSVGTYRGENLHPHVNPRIPLANDTAYWGSQIVYGSFRDYWWETSFGTIETNCEIINPWSESPYSETWLDLPNPRMAYSNHTATDDAIAAAINLGWIDPLATPPEKFDQIVVLSLPTWHPLRVSSSFGPQGVAIINNSVRYHHNPDSFYVIDSTPISLVNDGFFREENDSTDLDWLHIGLVCHEYGHLLGMVYDQTGGNCDGGYFALMSTGNTCGPDRRGECPPHVHAAGWYDLGVIQYLEDVGRGGFVDISSNMNNVELVAPSTQSVTVYRYAPPLCTDTFLIEAAATDPDHISDTWDSRSIPFILPPNFLRPVTDNNLFVWRFASTAYHSNFVEAGDSLGERDPYWPDWQGRTQDLWPGSGGAMSLTPFNVHYGSVTTPKSRACSPLQDTGFAILNIRGTAHSTTAGQNKVTVNFRVNWPWSITECFPSAHMAQKGREYYGVI